MSSVLLLGCLVLAGCAAPSRQPAAVDPAVKPGSVQAQYWSEQLAQQAEPAPAFDWIELHQPEHTEDGALRIPGVEYLRIPHTP